MNVCAVCGTVLRRDDLITARLGQTFHSRCVDRWNDDDPDDTLTPPDDVSRPTR